MQHIGIEDFLKLARQYPVLDVRSPGEYTHAHIPGAYSLPLFTDEERKVVGTQYKQQGRQPAIKSGLDYFGPKMRKMVEEVEIINSNFQFSNSRENNDLPMAPGNCVLIHCWRGGMRSAGVAWLMDLYGFKVYTLKGGYKAFRNYVLQQFEKPYRLSVIGGYTGSGKTDTLKKLSEDGHAVIDLEGIASHRGSAFGGLGAAIQPTQEMFENILAMQLSAVAETVQSDQPIWIEDESRRIGDINLPGSLWEAMRKAPISFLDVPFEARLKHITATYGGYKKEELVTSVMRIQKRLGGLATKEAVSFLLEGNYMACFWILLKYYDKYYEKDLRDRAKNPDKFFKITCTGTDAKVNSAILQQKQIRNGITGTGI